MSRLQPGNYVTVRGGGIAGAVIRFVTRSPVAHAYVYVGLHANGHDMIEAEPGGVRWGNTGDYPAEESYPSRRVLTAEQSGRALVAALDAVNNHDPYGWMTDMFLGMREGLHAWVPRWAFRLASKGRHMECAQLADWVGLQAGVHYFDDGRLPGEVAPADLWRLDYG